MDKKIIKVAFIDGVGGWFINHIKANLSNKYEFIVDSKNPDYVFYSVFGTEHIKYDCIRIFVTAENCRADFNFCDYAISFDYLEFEDRHLRYPYYLFCESFRKLVESNEDDSNEVDSSLTKRKFCSFVVSNGRANSIRSEIFDILSAYKKVDSGGKYKNNIGFRVENKHNFLSSYKFNIACENSSTNGYITEKLFDAKIANTIPIYYGGG